MIEVVSKEAKGGELLGHVWADSLTPEELRGLDLPPEAVDVGVQLPFAVSFSLCWEDGCPYPCIEGEVTIFNPFKDGAQIDAGEGRVDFDALHDDIELLGDAEEWHSDRLSAQIDDAYERGREAEWD